jgi:DNA gyrase subunit B
MANTKLDQKMIENIMSYADQIRTAESFVEIVRMKPGQFIGYIGNKGFINMVREIYQNILDEILKKDSPGSMGIISYDERTNTIIMEDNGRGIPFDNIVRIFSEQYTSSNYDKKDGDFSSGNHGVGGKVVNALSSLFRVESYRLGKARCVEFIDGTPWDKGEVEIANPGKQGAIITFIPSHEVMGDITVTCADVMALIQHLLPLCSIGAKIIFNGIDYSGREIHQEFVNEDGILTFLINQTTNPLIKPVIISRETGKMKVDIAFTYDSNSLVDENIITFANMSPTLSGTHLEGFLDGLTRYFRDYMNKIYLTKSKLNVVNTDIKTGLKAVVSVFHINPIFSSQAKEILGNEDMKSFVSLAVTGMLQDWIKTNPNDLQKLCKYYKDIAEIRVKSEEGKVKLSSKYESSTFSTMPKKYIKPEGKEHLELIIAEGNSAKGSAFSARDNLRQGIFPIRGKMPNALTTTKEKFLANEEVASILTILGAGYGRNFDITKCKFEKFIILADADQDGKHIRCLILRFLLLYCLPLVMHGRVYAAVPPLYSIVEKGKHIYFTDDLDFVKYIQTYFSKSNKICDINGRPLSEDDCTRILYNNLKYTDIMDSVSKTFAINPYLLEFVLQIRNLDFNTFKNKVESEYKFLEVFKQNGITMIKGLGEDWKTQRIPLSSRLLDGCTELINLIDNNMSSFTINGEKAGLLSLMTKFNNTMPSNLSRYKGIGEMDADQLAESALHPDMNRTLIQYTVKDIEKEINEIRAIESNKDVLLKEIRGTTIL